LLYVIIFHPGKSAAAFSYQRFLNSMQKLAIFLLLFSLASCTKESTNTNATVNHPNNSILSKGAWPIVQGNYWVYRDSIFEENGVLKTVNISDTLRTGDSSIYKGDVFYGTYNSLQNVYYRQVNDSTNELYNDFVKNAQIVFRQVSKNNTIILTTQSEVSVWVNDGFKKYQSVGTLTGYTDITTINGHDCIRNEFVGTYDGEISFKSILYVKPGLGIVRSLQYRMKQTPGNLYLHKKQDLQSYKLK
jgi:hypothetical protein